MIKNIAIAAGSLGSLPSPVKSDTVSPTARHRCDASSVRSSVEHREYYDDFDLIFLSTPELF